MLIEREPKQSSTRCRDPQIRAAAEMLGVDIVVLDEQHHRASVPLFTCGGSNARGLIVARSVDWERDVVPRLQRQRQRVWPDAADDTTRARFERERNVQLVVVHWVGGGNHYEPAMEV